MRRRTFSIAVVGADGSGKTSVAEALLKGGTIPLKYIYMGPATGSSTHSLPTTRFVHYLRKRAIGPMLNGSDSVPPSELMSAKMKKRLHRGPLLKTLGLINRVAEEWFRQIVSWSYRVRGYNVICDRHFLFEYCPDSATNRNPDAVLSERIHNWLLGKFYPQPSIVVFLDAPAEVLHDRKPEWTIEYLNKQRDRILEQGQATRNFSVVDANQPFDKVLADVLDRASGTIGVERTQ
jgi:thymidylate kinase